MGRFILFLVLLILFEGIQQKAVAQQSQSGSTLSSEQQKKIKDEIHNLQVLLSVASGDTALASGSGNKSWPEVADKLLGMVGGGVATIAGMIEKIAPHVWRIMIVQQYAEAAGDIFIPWGIFSVFLVYYLYVGKHWKKPQELGDSRDVWRAFAKVIPIIAMVVAGILAIVFTGGAAKRLINPEYYAIKDIFSMILQSPR